MMHYFYVLEIVFINVKKYFGTHTYVVCMFVLLSKVFSRGIEPLWVPSPLVVRPPLVHTTTFFRRINTSNREEFNKGKLSLRY
jgi:hypothetical protein